jgi:hypothetical protein
MSDKIARLGIERDNDLMYYIKIGDVWASPRKKPGQTKCKARKIAPIGVDLDYSKYLYYVDSDGDVARKARALGGGGRKKKATKAAPTPSKPSRAAAASAAPAAKRGGKKSIAQLEREIEECLARPPGTGNGTNGTAGNGSPRNGKRGGKKAKGKKARR